MSTFTGLCIGGPLDGVVQHSRSPDYRVPRFTLTETGRVPCGSSNEAGHFTYTYRDFIYDNTTIGIFIPKGKTFAWAMSEILKRYAK